MGASVATVRGSFKFRLSLDDSASGSRGLSVDGKRVIGFEMQVAFDSEAEPEPNRGDFRETEVAQLGKAVTVIAESEKSVAVGRVEFAEQPRRCSAGIEEPHYRRMVLVAASPVREQQLTLRFRQ